MPSVYEKLGICFQFPDNWTLDEKDAQQGENAVTVFSPGGAFWSVAIHPRAVPLQEMCDVALKAMRETYEELDAEQVKETVAGRELSGYDLNFYCLDLTNTALIRAAKMGSGNLLVLCQADDREFAQVEPVFRAMTHSLLSRK